MNHTKDIRIVDADQEIHFRPRDWPSHPDVEHEVWKLNSSKKSKYCRRGKSPILSKSIIKKGTDNQINKIPDSPSLI